MEDHTLCNSERLPLTRKLNENNLKALDESPESSDATEELSPDAPSESSSDDENELKPNDEDGPDTSDEDESDASREDQPTTIDQDEPGTHDEDEPDASDGDDQDTSDEDEPVTSDEDEVNTSDQDGLNTHKGNRPVANDQTEQDTTHQNRQDTSAGSEPHVNQVDELGANEQHMSNLAEQDEAMSDVLEDARTDLPLVVKADVPSESRMNISYMLGTDSQRAPKSDASDGSNSDISNNTGPVDNSASSFTSSAPSTCDTHEPFKTNPTKTYIASDSLDSKIVHLTCETTSDDFSLLPTQTQLATNAPQIEKRSSIDESQSSNIENVTAPLSSDHLISAEDLSVLDSSNMEQLINEFSSLEQFDFPFDVSHVSPEAFAKVQSQTQLNDPEVVQNGTCDSVMRDSIDQGAHDNKAIAMITAALNEHASVDNPAAIEEADENPQENSIYWVGLENGLEIEDQDVHPLAFLDASTHFYEDTVNQNRPVFESMAAFQDKKYNLRHKFRDPRKTITGNVDDDNSGTFDPSNVHQAMSDSGSDEHDASTSKRTNGKKKTAKFAISSAGKTSLKRKRAIEDEVDATRTENQNGHFKGLLGTLELDETVPIIDLVQPPEDEQGAEEEQQISGCQACASRSKPCSLLSEPESYPCTACYSADFHTFECRLIIDPVKKIPCQMCRRKGLDCSYEDREGDHSKPCVQCANNAPSATGKRLPCIAGPWVKPTDKKTVEVEKLGHLQIEAAKILETAVKAPAKSAAKNTKSLQPTPGRKPALKDPKKSRASDTDPKKPSRSLNITTIPLRDSDGAVGTTKTIWTAFAHPMTFNVPSTHNNHCNWCASLKFGMFGYDNRLVEVIDWGRGEPYEEVADGHTGDGRSPTTMCTDCTSERVEIAQCPRHVLLPIHGRSPHLISFTAEYAKMRQNIPKHHPDAGVWCALCPAPAFFECAWGSRSDEIVKCGLVLCKDCAMLVQKKGGKLPKIFDSLDFVKKRKEWFQMGVRADAKLLLKSGDLYNAVSVANQRRGR